MKQKKRLPQEPDREIVLAKTDAGDWSCPCPMGHPDFEECEETEDNCFCQEIECGGKCVYDERKNEEAPTQG